MDLRDIKVRQRVNKVLRERGVPAKVCSKCFSLKALTLYPADKVKRDGRSPACRTCGRARGAAYRDANKNQLAVKKRQWLVANPGYMRQWRAGRPGYGEYMREYMRRWNEEHPEYQQNYQREWSRKNPEKRRMHRQIRRARLASATIEPFTPRDLRADWEEHDLYDCFFCGGPATPLHVDHFYPLKPADEDAPPGPHAIFNLVPACETCNLSKSNRDPWTFLRESLAERGVDMDACLKFFSLD